MLSVFIYLIVLVLLLLNSCTLSFYMWGYEYLTFWKIYSLVKSQDLAQCDNYIYVSTLKATSEGIFTYDYHLWLKLQLSSKDIKFKI